MFSSYGMTRAKYIYCQDCWFVEFCHLECSLYCALRQPTPGSASPASTFLHSLTCKNGCAISGAFLISLHLTQFFWKSDSLETIREGRTATSLCTFYTGASPRSVSVLFIYLKRSENRVLRSTELIISKMLLTHILSSAVLIRMEWVHRLHTILGRSIRVPWQSEPLFSFSKSLQ